MEQLQASPLVPTGQVGAEVSEASAAMTVKNKERATFPPYLGQHSEAPHWSWFTSVYSATQYTSNQMSGPDLAYVVAKLPLPSPSTLQYVR